MPVAFAQTYFAVQTRKQELIEQRILEVERVNARNKLSQTEKKLSGIIYERGVNDQIFAIIRSKGDNSISKEHIDNNKAVRKMLLNRGVEPENLSPAEDVKKVECRLHSEEKKMLKDAKKKKR